MLYCIKKYYHELSLLLSKYSLNIRYSDENKDIPGSWFGEEEAGLIANTLYIREDTPIHSLLHESCHYICMDSIRRKDLDTNAGGGYDEENGVCFLQIILAEQLNFTSSKEQMQDMDDWGYTFRLGSASTWFHKDANDAKQWLLDYNLIEIDNKPTYELRI
jgi:hypothetical protein